MGIGEECPLYMYLLDLGLRHCLVAFVLIVQRNFRIQLSQ